MKMKYLLTCVAMTAMLPAFVEAQNKRDIAVRTDRQNLSENGTWIYDDLDAAIANATETKRPLMVVFR